MKLVYEIAWGWPEIAVVLIWKIAPNGFVMAVEDLVTLPRERVLVEERKPDSITLSFVTLATAKKLMAAERGEERATLSELQGRWQKIAICTAWHFARLGKLGRKDSIVLTEQDRQAVPGHLKLMASGHADGIEFRFLPRAEAEAIAKWDLDNEGIMIREKTQL
jgi:hypothetical protein